MPGPSGPLYIAVLGGLGPLPVAPGSPCLPHAICLLSGHHPRSCETSEALLLGKACGHHLDSEQSPQPLWAKARPRCRVTQRRAPPQLCWVGVWCGGDFGNQQSSQDSWHPELTHTDAGMPVLLCQPCCWDAEGREQDTALQLLPAGWAEGERGEEMISEGRGGESPGRCANTRVLVQPDAASHWEQTEG